MNYFYLRRLCAIGLTVILVMISSQTLGSRQQSDSASSKHHPQIIIDDTLRKDMLPTWLYYAGCRAHWYQERFYEKYPHEKSYQYTFDEEFECRQSMVGIWQSFVSENKELKDRYLSDLVNISKANFLKEYIWVNFFVSDWQKPADLRLSEFQKWSERNLKKHKVETRALLQIEN